MSGSTANTSRPARKALIIIGAVTLALVTTVVLAEVGLRVAAWALLSARDDMPSEGSDAILCLGDSWTFNAADDDPGQHSYPSQLQRLVDRAVGKWKYRVINRGRPGLDSTTLRHSLPAMLKQYRPAILVVLTGGTQGGEVGRGADDIGYQPGLLERLRVVRIWSSRATPTRGASARPLDRVLEPGKVRDALINAVSQPQRTKAGPDDGMGIPAARDTGCLRPKQLNKKRAEVDAAMALGPEALDQVLNSEPTCVPLLVHAADICFGRRDFKCVNKLAQKALLLQPGEPRATVILSAVRHHLKRPIPADDLSQMNHVISEHPGFIRARRLKLLTMLLGKVTLCELRRELAAARRMCSGCGWTKTANEIFQGKVQVPGSRRLTADLTAIHQMSRAVGTRLLLLNYPSTEPDTCSNLAPMVTARFAKQQKVKIIEIEDILGVVESRNTRFFGAQKYPNTKGNNFLAREILRELTAIGWIKNRVKVQM